MIEDMMGVLKSEQEADDSQKSFCNKDLASSANQKEDLEGEVEASGALISETQESVEMITSEVASLQAEVKELDKAVSDSTRQRQQEHEEFLTFTQENNGVLALMDNLAQELSDSIAEAKHDEETSQRDYESLMARSQATRQKTVESITNKEAAKADLDTKAERAKE